MTHFLVTQLRFARLELKRCLDGVSEEDGQKQLAPMNAISWMVGHLANQEHFYWVVCGSNQSVAPELNEIVGYGKPATQPSLNAMWQSWEQVTTIADRYLDTLTPEVMTKVLNWQDKPLREDVGTMLLRNIHHYWFHIGEAHAVRQLLGHANLPDFVGRMQGFGYQPERH